MDHPRPSHYLLLPVVEKSDNRYEIHPVTPGTSAFRVEQSEHPILFSQLGQLRHVPEGGPVPGVGYMVASMPNRGGTIELSYLRPPVGHPREPHGLFYVTDNKGTTYMVREIPAGRPSVWIWEHKKGDVLHLHAKREAHRPLPPQPAIVIPDEEGDDEDNVIDVDAMDKDVGDDLEEEILSDLPASLAPELTSHPLEGVKLFSTLRPVLAPVSDNEMAAMLEIVSYLIGELSTMMMVVDREDRVAWAVFSLQHHLRVRLDRELGQSTSVQAQSRWPRRFDTFRRLYEQGASMLLHSQGLYGPYDVPAFGESAHDDLHPSVLLRRARGVFSLNKKVRAAVCKASGVKTAQDQVDVLIALCLGFCRRHVHNIYFARDADTNNYTRDFARFMWATHEDEDWRVEERLRAYLDDYEGRLAHPRPSGVDLHHPMLQLEDGPAAAWDDDAAAEYSALEREHREATLEAEHLFAEEERQSLARLQRERQRAVQKDAEAKDEEAADDTPLRRKQPGATPQGSPTEVDARICAGIQRLMSRLLDQPSSSSSSAMEAATQVAVVAAAAAVAPSKPDAKTTTTAASKKEDARLPSLPKLPSLRTKLDIPAVVVAVSCRCAMCFKPEPRGRCPCCKIPYCDADCQCEHWEAGHKNECQGYEC
jgi:hypothetical protein